MKRSKNTIVVTPHTDADDNIYWSATCRGVSGVVGHGLTPVDAVQDFCNNMDILEDYEEEK